MHPTDPGATLNALETIELAEILHYLADTLPEHDPAHLITNNELRCELRHWAHRLIPE